MRRKLSWIFYVILIWIAFALRSAIAQSAFDRARCFGDGATGDARIAACDRLLEFGSPRSTDLAFAFANRANGWLANGNYTQATADFDAAIRLNPTYAGAYVGRATVWFAKQELDRAIADLDKAIELDRRNARAFALRGIVKLRGLVVNQQYTPDRVFADFETAIKLNPKEATAYLGRGEAYSFVKAYARALDDFDEALRLEPRNELALIDRARIYELALIDRAKVGPAANSLRAAGDPAVEAAIAISGYIELMVRRLGVCADFDTQNRAVYVLIAPEFIREQMVGDALTKTNSLIEAALRRVDADLTTAQAARRQGLDLLEQDIRKQAQRAPDRLVADCRILAENFTLRRGPFAPLPQIFPSEMGAIQN